MEYLKAEYGSDTDEDVDFSVMDADSKSEFIQFKGIVGTHVPDKAPLSLKSCTEDIESDLEKNIIKEEVPVSNFLGLPSSSHLQQEESNCKQPNLCVRENQYQTVQLGDTSVQVEIPSTSFWKESTDDLDIQDLQLQKWPSGLPVKCKNQEKESPKNTHKRFSKSSDKFATSKYFKDEQSDSKFSSTSETHKTKCDTNASKRKMYFVHSKIQPLLHMQSQHCKSPRSALKTEMVHTGVVNRVQWCIPSYSHLFVSCSMDSSLRVWNTWSQLDPCVQVLPTHNKAVKDVIWSKDGRQLLSASYDRTAAVTDVEKGTVVSQLIHRSFVSCIRTHPVSPHLCLTGENNQILSWDTRSPQTPCKTFTYKDKMGQIQDLLFENDGSTFFSCSDLVSRDSSDRNLMAWDFTSGVTLSNQIYQERYTVTRLKGCRRDHQILAQSQGNYIAIFSKDRPYKMCRHKRFDGHKIHGYSIGFDLSSDEQLVYSGSSDGKIYCYNYQTGRLCNRLSTGMDVVMDVACHPVLPSTLVACGWNGQIELWS